MLRRAVGCLIAAIASLVLLAFVLVLIAVFTLGTVEVDPCEQHDVAVARRQRVVDLHASWDRSEAGGWLTPEETAEKKAAQPIPEILPTPDGCA